MRYLRFALSSILVLVTAAVVIWLGVFAIIFSLIIAPILAWFIRRKTYENKPDAGTSKQEAPVDSSYKVIEAEYEIIEK